MDIRQKLRSVEILQSIGVDYIDKSEVLTPADNRQPIPHQQASVQEGAATIRTKGEAGTGNVVEAVRHQCTVMSQIRQASVMSEEELYVFAKEIQAPFHLLKETARLKRLPVVNFAAAGMGDKRPTFLLQLELEAGSLASQHGHVLTHATALRNIHLVSLLHVQLTTAHDNSQGLTTTRKGSQRPKPFHRVLSRHIVVALAWFDSTSTLSRWCLFDSTSSLSHCRSLDSTSCSTQARINQRFDTSASITTWDDEVDDHMMWHFDKQWCSRRQVEILGV
ncbi:hypothetical protein D9619_002370 [Psilocybe cf. subviscida]|uniref:pyridoxal 5'-phosphate synthase (glutamine hydrolyzing) n=1 Tax=Psilocybe cf. subviscida TaxID=2480587 RepID=A0A8H5AY84_9AGAR|nr:hypothetical protein D9619_002370 [Psilocybe cf. subviscida]